MMARGDKILMTITRTSGLVINDDKIDADELVRETGKPNKQQLMP